LIFFKSEKAGGFVLIGCTIIALFVANSLFSGTYAGIEHSCLNLSFAGVDIKYSVEHWVNDGLMAIFFFVA
jgi:NhaA family Na+:H+ antiporter